MHRHVQAYTHTHLKRKERGLQGLSEKAVPMADQAGCSVPGLAVATLCAPAGGEEAALGSNVGRQLLEATQGSRTQACASLQSGFLQSWPCEGSENG